MNTLKFLLFIVVISCNQNFKSPIIGNWTVVFTDFDKTTYSEITFESNLNFFELIDGHHIVEKKYKTFNDSIKIGLKKYKMEVSNSGNTISLHQKNKKIILNRIGSKDYCL